VCRRLANRLQACGFAVEQYDLAGAALLASLRDTFGARYDEAAEGYWGELYGEAAEAMLASLRD
jgi:hemoglobin-like flavoprotein